MKTILLVMAMLTYTLSFAQEFLGIKVDGKRDDVIAQFRNKGFILDKVPDSKTTVASMTGMAGSNKVDLHIVWSPVSKTVWKFGVFLPEQSSWYSLKSDYEKYLQILTEKYGDPTNSYNFFSEPYKEGDGYEMSAVASEKCNFIAFWKESIIVEITKWKEVKISYENTINSNINERETKSLDKSVF